MITTVPNNDPLEFISFKDATNRDLAHRVTEATNLLNSDDHRYGMMTVNPVLEDDDPRPVAWRIYGTMGYPHVYGYLRTNEQGDILMNSPVIITSDTDGIRTSSGCYPAIYGPEVVSIAARLVGEHLIWGARTGRVSGDFRN